MKRYFNHLKNKRAFTLIELMVVISILAVLSGMGIGSYRKALMRNAFFEDAEQLSSTLNNMANIAKTAGLLMDNSNRVLLRNDDKAKALSTTANTLQVGGKNTTCLVWRLYKNNVLQTEGTLGGRYSNVIHVDYTSGFKNGVTALQDNASKSSVTVNANSLKSGTWMSFYKVEAAKKKSINANTAPTFSIVYRSDGTPLYGGYLKLYTDGKITKKQIKIDIDKFGGVKVNDTIGT